MAICGSTPPPGLVPSPASPILGLPIVTKESHGKSAFDETANICLVINTYRSRDHLLGEVDTSSPGRRPSGPRQPRRASPSDEDEG